MSIIARSGVGFNLNQDLNSEAVHAVSEMGAGGQAGPSVTPTGDPFIAPVDRQVSTDPRQDRISENKTATDRDLQKRPADTDTEIAVTHQGPFSDRRSRNSQLSVSEVGSDTENRVEQSGNSTPSGPFISESLQNETVGETDTQEPMPPENRNAQSEMESETAYQQPTPETGPEIGETDPLITTDAVATDGPGGIMEDVEGMESDDGAQVTAADISDKLPLMVQEGIKNHEIFAGFHANFNLPLIFNQNTYEVFNGKELAYKPTFGMASGLRVGYTYGKQYGIETGFIFYSKQGQNYEETFNGVRARRQVRLQYFQIPIVLRYKFNEKKVKNAPSPWVIDLGMQVDLLQTAVITYNGNDFALNPIQNPAATDKDYFRATNVSLVFGLEREIYFTKFLFLGIGVRTAFSSDINAKDRPVVNDGKDYEKSHNFVFGFTLSLNGALQR